VLNLWRFLACVTVILAQVHIIEDVCVLVQQAQLNPVAIK
jgi:hypothetical protein